MSRRPGVIVLGVGDEGLASLAVADRARLDAADCLCGGARHLAMLCAGGRETIPIVSPLEVVYERIGSVLAQERTVAVLASGDPCCFGIGPLLVERFGQERVEIVPTVSAAQLAFARVGEAWQDARLVSAHGRPVEGIIGPVLSAYRSAVLTDAQHTPGVIAQALHACGMEDCRVVVAERLGGARERIVESSLFQIETQSFDPLNLLLVLRAADAPLLTPRVGLSDDSYAHRDGMITKAEVRAVSLSQLAIQPGDIVWDVGAGCGSVALEAASFVQHGFVYAVERDVRQVGFMQGNLSRLSGPMRIVEGESPEALRGLPSPHAVFLGGSGGKLTQTIQTIIERMEPSGRLVANFVVLDHLMAARQQLSDAGWQVRVTQVAVHRQGSLGRFEALNPVFVLYGARE